MSTETLHLPAKKERQYRFPRGVEHNLLWEGLKNLGPIDPLRFFERLKRDYGKVGGYRVGNKRVVFLADAELIREVLVVQNDNFVKGEPVRRTKVLLGNGMITAEQQDWRSQRQAAQPAFHRQRIRSYADQMVGLTIETRDRIAPGIEFDLAQMFMELALKVVGKTLFDTDLDHEAGVVAHEISNIMDVYNFMMAVPAPQLMLHLPWPQVIKFRKARRRVDETVNRMIESHLHGPKRDCGDLLSMMIQAIPDVETPEGKEQLRDQVVTIFLAGYETTANALSWTFRLLGENPEVERRVLAEVDDVLNGRMASVEDVPQLKYIEMVLAESMRLYPPAWAMVRQGINDFQLGDYFLPGGTTVMMSQWVMHRSEEFWLDPLRFDPERFRPEAKAGRPKFAYFPFGGGGRQCIGEAFAWMEGALLLATLVQKYRFRLVAGQTFEPQSLITLRPRNGVRVVAEARG
ncbi:cytochrome P450 [Candidatus Koribacter versatilis Ellin345]|uniref:Cytochrome P450 n=1 Tax=Koribacter versatilis (strain Ellin345) TaxID=204669 RepID=Q1IM54_KORVE|nr:cytochrome P450 [Candidatus Koribacter versatilis]ABF42046.1 cytochrome P450 [Candidatus Koribacter versatilis Ellin345]